MSDGSSDWIDSSEKKEYLNINDSVLYGNSFDIFDI